MTFLSAQVHHPQWRVWTHMRGPQAGEGDPSDHCTALLTGVRTLSPRL